MRTHAQTAHPHTHTRAHMCTHTRANAYPRTCKCTPTCMQMRAPVHADTRPCTDARPCIDAHKLVQIRAHVYNGAQACTCTRNHIGAHARPLVRTLACRHTCTQMPVETGACIHPHRHAHAHTRSP